MDCQLCHSAAAYNFHHFIPRTMHSNKWFKARFSREQMKEGIDVCRECHHAIHEFVPSEKDLGRDYNSLEKLLSHPKIVKHIEWMKGS